MLAFRTLFCVRKFDSQAVDAILCFMQPELRQHSLRRSDPADGSEASAMYDLSLAMCRCELPTILELVANMPRFKAEPLLGACDILFLSNASRTRASTDHLASRLISDTVHSEGRKLLLNIASYAEAGLATSKRDAESEK